MSTKIYYEVDGLPVPAEECMWVVTAPCGCECSWALANYTRDENEAWKDFARSKAVRQRDEKLGYTMSVKRRGAIPDDCTHTPKWGVEPRPKPDGHTWAAKHGGRVVHLVPLVIEKDDYAYESKSIPSICEKATCSVWSTRWSDTEGLIDCAACVSKAVQP